MSTRAKRVLCAVGAGVILLLLAFALSLEVMWVGYTDLTVPFVVMGARTGAPIRGGGTRGPELWRVGRRRVADEARPDPIRALRTSN